MSALVLLALAALDAGVELPLRATPPAPRLVPVSTSSSSSAPCTLERHRYDDKRVTEQWVARCPSLEGPWLATEPEPRVAVVGLYGQQYTDTTLAFRPGEAVAFARTTPPGWVPPTALARLAALRATPVPGFGRLAEDARDGAVLGHSHQRGYLRLAKEGARPLFSLPLPREAGTPMHALVFDADAGVQEPWLAYAPDPWRRVEVRLRSPAGEERLLYERPARSHGGSYRVTSLDALRAAPFALPTLGVMADRDFLLFTPASKTALAPFLVRRAPAPSLGERPLPPGETGRPRREGAPCSEVQQQDEDEAVLAPKLFAWQGRTFVAFVSQVQHTTRRLGPVPRSGKTPAEDRLTCDWIVDAQSIDVSLAVGEVTATGAVRELVRTALELVPSDGHGLRTLLAVEGDELLVVTSQLGALVVTRVDLPAATTPRARGKGSP